MKQPIALVAGVAGVDGASEGKVRIDDHAALLGLVRAWLATRDTIVYCLVQGLDPDECLEEIDLQQAQVEVEQANDLRRMILDRVTRMAESPARAQAVLRSIITDLLANETPIFPLTLDGESNSF